MLDICVLLATLNRPAGLVRVLKSLNETAPNLPVMVATDPDDAEARKLAGYYGCLSCACPEPRKGPGYAWNTALRAAPSHLAYVLAADDLIFKPGWLEATLAALEKIGNSGMVGFNDGQKNGKIPGIAITHYLLTRDFIIRHNGGVMCCPHYRTWGVDTETTDRAKRAKCFVWAENAHVYHDWQGESPTADETYKQARPFHARDKETYHRRKKAGFPDDFPRILGAE